MEVLQKNTIFYTVGRPLKILTGTVTEDNSSLLSFQISVRGNIKYNKIPHKNYYYEFMKDAY